ncbi:MAG: polyphenol oxidase family protein, partial [Candidatus Kapaibacteriota bacterium]
PRNLLVYISPLASGKRYEVGEDVAKLFPLSTIPTPNGKYFFDNRKEIIYQLKETGVEEKNIEYSPLCTISNTNLHSYRRDKEKSGRMAAFIGLKK